MMIRMFMIFWMLLLWLVSHSSTPDADSPGSPWSALEEKRYAMTVWPKDRINLNAFYHRDEDRDEKVDSSGHRNCILLKSILRWLNVSPKVFVPGAHFLKKNLGVSMRILLVFQRQKLKQ